MQNNNATSNSPRPRRQERGTEKKTGERLIAVAGGGRRRQVPATMVTGRDCVVYSIQQPLPRSRSGYAAAQAEPRDSITLATH